MFEKQLWDRWLVALMAFGCILIGGGLLLTLPATASPIPLVTGVIAGQSTDSLEKVVVRRVANVTSSNGSVSLKTLAGTVDGSDVCIVNKTANQLNVGGPDVDNSTKFYSVCSSGCDTDQPVCFHASPRVISIRAASSTVTTVIVIVGSPISS